MKPCLKRFLIGGGSAAVLTAVVGAAGVVALMRTGLSARPDPGALETWAATRVQRLSVPERYAALPNPLSVTDQVLRAAMEHWADHCASCHANDGSVRTELGSHMYPRPPDMRQPHTQQLADGELYYVINQGIRFTGMPAWGAPGDGDMDSWALVSFIRTLPTLTPDQIETMKRMNPVSAASVARKRQEDDFLSGQSDSAVHSEGESH
jgi:mono/diheme cytochrome c family protein